MKHSGLSRMWEGKGSCYLFNILYVAGSVQVDLALTILMTILGISIIFLLSHIGN